MQLGSKEGKREGGAYGRRKKRSRSLHGVREG
jgi:hypothetical protein